jgi:hypothetical protein
MSGLTPRHTGQKQKRPPERRPLRRQNQIQKQSARLKGGRYEGKTKFKSKAPA